MLEDKYVSKQETNGQRLTVSFADKAQFVDQGLRGFFQYRDLGLKASTGGRFHGQVIRAKRGLNESTGVHSHVLDFQLIYILKGAVTVRSELDGVFRLKAGDSVLQPPGGKHEVLHCSDDLEFLEITSPAEYETVQA
ncbi:MAG: cupin domain-containing protein [Betaproteobacteria bacterium]|nr:cupin domain-containing protein [Betaproteobacteria bacterium]